jgi:hypothetical protein
VLWLIDKVASSEGALSAVLTAALLSVGYLLRLAFAARSKVLWGLTENNHFLVREADGSFSTLRTHNYLFQNTGRKSAEKLQVVLNFSPQHFEVFPHLPYSQATRPDGRIFITFEKLHAKQFIRFAMFRINGELPEITLVSFDGGPAKRINFQTVRKYSDPVNYLIVFVVLIGALSIIYWSVRWLIHLVG